MELSHFTDTQQLIICSIIEDWYLEWCQNLIVNPIVGQTHRLGYAKEKLKERLCDSKNKFLIEDNDNGK